MPGLLVCGRRFVRLLWLLTGRFACPFDSLRARVCHFFMSPSTDSYEYILYVDEAGDDGLKSLKPENPQGSTEWLCLAGYLVRRDQDEKLPEVVRSIRAEIDAKQSRTLHYKDLSASKRLKACQLLASHPARAFVVCSYKRTMLGHSNARAAARSGGTKQYLYNFLVRFLLERVTDFVWLDSSGSGGGVPKVVRIIFSNRGGHRYGQMKAYFQQLRMQATAGTTFLSARVIRPEVLRFDQIEYVPHYQLAGLQLADIVASSFFQALDTHSTAWSIAPAVALGPLVARETVPNDTRRTAADYGVTLVPRPHRANLLGNQRELFARYGYIFDDDYRYR